MGFPNWIQVLPEHQHVVTIRQVCCVYTRTLANQYDVYALPAIIITHTYRGVARTGPAGGGGGSKSCISVAAKV